LGDLSLRPLSHALSRWQRIHNHIRPHRALDRRPPADYIRARHPQLAQHCLTCTEPMQLLVLPARRR